MCRTGCDETANRLVRQHGTPPQLPVSRRKTMWRWARALGLMDFARAGKLSGARFVVLDGASGADSSARSAQFMLDLHAREFGYTEVAPPLLVRDETAFGTGQLPKFADDLFRTTTRPVAHSRPPRCRSPTSSPTRCWTRRALPLRYTAWTPCFRSEAGAAGKDTRGMIRQHQFTKVELVSIAHPDRSEDEHERMTACAEEVLKRLGLAYRVMLLCAGDMGAAARKTYDIEVWLPGQNAYREISSCSQLRRLPGAADEGALPAEGRQGRRASSTRSTARALPWAAPSSRCSRTTSAATARVAVPPALRPYMGGLEAIGGDV